MTEFIQKGILPYLVYFQIITAIIISIYNYKLKTPVLKAFVMFFWYAVLNEFIGDLYSNYINSDSNYIVYNVYFIIAFSYLFCLYHSSIKNKTFQKVIIGFGFLYALSIGYELFFEKMNYFKVRQAKAYIVGGISVLICILFYFFEVLNSKEIIKIDRKIIFWISIAYFFYYLAMIPFKVYQNSYAISDPHKYLFSIIIIMTLLMNLILIFGFTWSKQKKH